MNAVMVDRFDYPVETARGIEVDKLGDVFAQSRVKLVRVDFASEAVPLDADSAHVVTCLAVVEHLHNSPRPLFAELRRILKPRGKLVVSAPNAVNLRKRFSVLLGRTNLPPMRRFYLEGDPFWYGHVHEPTAKELAWLLKESGFNDVTIFGRNFVGAQNYGLIARFASPILQIRPGLCSDLYAVGHAQAVIRGNSV
jgi:SAM-dependent methyltransferase